jgi:hypothetical protein
VERKKISPLLLLFADNLRTKKILPSEKIKIFPKISLFDDKNDFDPITAPSPGSTPIFSSQSAVLPISSPVPVDNDNQSTPICINQYQRTTKGRISVFVPKSEVNLEKYALICTWNGSARYWCWLQTPS